MRIKVFHMAIYHQYFGYICSLLLHPGLRNVCVPTRFFLPRCWQTTRAPTKSPTENKIHRVSKPSTEESEISQQQPTIQITEKRPTNSICIFCWNRTKTLLVSRSISCRVPTDDNSIALPREKRSFGYFSIMHVMLLTNWLHNRQNAVFIVAYSPILFQWLH